jgi:hypothetical protein
MRLEFVGSIEKRQQIAGELRSVDARPVPEVAVARGHSNAGAGNAAFRPAPSTAPPPPTVNTRPFRRRRAEARVVGADDSPAAVSGRWED